MCSPMVGVFLIPIYACASGVVVRCRVATVAVEVQWLMIAFDDRA